MWAELHGVYRMRAQMLMVHTRKNKCMWSMAYENKCMWSMTCENKCMWSTECENKRMRSTACGAQLEKIPLQSQAVVVNGAEVNLYRFGRATGECVGSSFVLTRYYPNVRAGKKTDNWVYIFRWLHTTGSCSQDISQTSSLPWQGLG